MNDKVKEALETLANIVYANKDYVFDAGDTCIWLYGPEASYLQELIKAKASRNEAQS